MIRLTKELEGRVAVVVGGTSGIGRSIALGLARAGADVVPTSRRIEQVRETADEVESLGVRSLAIASDVRERSGLETLREGVLSNFGAVDILVNCAGILVRRPTLEVTDEEWEQVLDVNLTGTLRSCQIFGAPMLDQGRGRIINIASLNTFVSLLEVSAYAASKAAVGALTKSLAVEWGARGVLVNAIAPGVVRTDLNSAMLDGTERGRELLMRTPMKRFASPEEVVGAAVFLAGDSSSFVNGEIIVVDGGFLANGVNS